MRRYEQPAAPTPPYELISYHRWCANRDLTPYCHDQADRAGVRAAIVNFRRWELDRALWAAAHDVDVWDLDAVDHEPWDDAPL